MIKLLILDVDGTLTDGRVFYGKYGEALQGFDRRDGHGIMLAKQAGIEVIWLTGKVNPATEQRARDLDCRVMESKDKKYDLASLMSFRNLTADDVAYVGDDLPDYECRDLVRNFFAPADNVLKPGSSFTALTRKGGNGAVREAIDLLLEYR